MNHNSQPRRASKNRLARRAIGAASVIAAVAIVGCGDGKTSQHEKVQYTQIETPAKPAMAEAGVDNVRVREGLGRQARKSATRILDFLGNPKSGAQAYGGNAVGNKERLLGPDFLPGTGDDMKSAHGTEALLQFSPDLDGGTITAYSYREVPGTKGIEGVNMLFRVGSDAKIAQKSGQLNASDFRTAINSDSTTFVALEALTPDYKSAIGFKNDGTATYSTLGLFPMDDFDTSKPIFGAKLERAADSLIGQASSIVPGQE